MKKIFLLLICLLTAYTYSIPDHQEGFVAGTLIKTVDGYKPIEELKAGDEIIGDDNSDTKFVIEVSQKTIFSYIKIFIGNETISAAPHQKFYLAQQGTWIEAQDITTAHWLLGKPDIYFPVHLVEKVDQETEVYAISVQDQTFYVTPYNIRVHNMSAALQATAITIGSITAVNPILATIGAGIALVTIGMKIYEKLQSNPHEINNADLLQERRYYEKRKQDLSKLKQEFLNIKQGLETITVIYRNDLLNFTFKFLHQLQVLDIPHIWQPSTSQELQLNDEQKENLREFRELELEQLEDQIVDLQLSIVFHFSELIYRKNEAIKKYYLFVPEANKSVEFWDKNPKWLSNNQAISYQENILTIEDLLENCENKIQELKFALNYYVQHENASIIKKTTNILEVIKDQQKNIDDITALIERNKNVTAENKQFSEQNLIRHGINGKVLTDNINGKIKKDREQQKLKELAAADKKKTTIQKPEKAPGKPTEKDGFFPPKNWDGEKIRHPKTGQVGWPDEKGNIWVPSGPKGHGGPHWDIQYPDGKRYDNVYPGGKVRPGKK
jgi:hypothetical protein